MLITCQNRAEHFRPEDRETASLDPEHKIIELGDPVIRLDKIKIKQGDDRAVLREFQIRKMKIIMDVRETQSAFGEIPSEITQLGPDQCSELHASAQDLPDRFVLRAVNSRERIHVFF
ncbi:MAG: hypothetical protein BWY42_01501 [Candidatus Omnitrophica bacterium ADurb.Bin277]|nr:MAG: hypothetical protein BWY42_01501 [Candidatus Omnitrophica bacterium ADurb.Bin277]